jgi:hypothetical protein
LLLAVAPLVSSEMSCLNLQLILMNIPGTRRAKGIHRLPELGTYRIHRTRHAGSARKICAFSGLQMRLSRDWPDYGDGNCSDHHRSVSVRLSPTICRLDRARTEASFERVNGSQTRQWLSCRLLARRRVISDRRGDHRIPGLDRTRAPFARAKVIRSSQTRLPDPADSPIARRIADNASINSEARRPLRAVERLQSRLGGRSSIDATAAVTSDPAVGYGGPSDRHCGLPSPRKMRVRLPSSVGRASSPITACSSIGRPRSSLMA